MVTYGILRLCNPGQAHSFELCSIDILGRPSFYCAYEHYRDKNGLFWPV
jgi:hypothetical protein